MLYVRAVHVSGAIPETEIGSIQSKIDPHSLKHGQIKPLEFETFNSADGARLVSLISFVYFVS